MTHIVLMCIQNCSRLALISMLAISISSITATSSIYADEPLRIMPVGDSITVGYTNFNWSGGAYEFGYRSGLYTRLIDAGYNFQFVGNSTEPESFRDPATTDPNYPPTIDLKALGQGGHHAYQGINATQLLNGAEGKFVGIEDAMNAADPDIVLLKIGTNGQDNNALLELVNSITTTKPNTELIIAQIMPKNPYQQGIVDYNAYIRDTLVPAQQSLGRNVSVVNQYSNFLTDPDDLESIDTTLFGNGFNHPDNDGYDLMAQTWFEGIEAVVPEPSSMLLLGLGGVTLLQRKRDYFD